jgi:RHS repeat-associated protein
MTECTDGAITNSSGPSYYRARYYDPNAGRFLAEDSTRFASGTYDFYPYVNNDPQNHGDAYGLQKDGGETCCQDNIDIGRAELERALNNAQLMRGRIVKKYKDCLLKTLPVLKIKCNPTAKDCGLHVPVAVDTVVITPLGSKGRKGPCGPVASTFLHEMIHLCYNLDLSAPKMSRSDQEKEAQDAECEVFGYNCRKR